MAKWRERDRDRIEYPAWVRAFVPDDWSEPDGQEMAMGNIPEDCRLVHARRRWAAACHEWFQGNPDASAQAFDDIVNGYRERRRQFG
jgi:hypothetical protein